MASKDNKCVTTKLSASFEQEKSVSSTLKRNPKMELSKTDLLKLLSYLEGELQARDVVIATLKAEKVKRLLTPGRCWPNSLNDPRAALQRDSFGGAEPAVDEEHIQALADHQMVALDNYVLQHRRMTCHMAKLLKEMEERHRKVVQDLEDEKRKHEHDTAQGDDITYGLEKERTRLKQELELEKTFRKKAEKDLKKVTDMLDEEKARTKSIVLLLIAERKKALIKYVEERKRSEDLAQILAEEKNRIDAMAEGLEEESKKSLQMEAELEKQLAQFDTERQQLKSALAKEEKRYKDLEAEAEKRKGEAYSFKKQLAEAHQVAMFQAGAGTPGLCPRPPQPPVKPAIVSPQPLSSPRPVPPPNITGSKIPWSGNDENASPSSNSMLSSVAKVVQPTATVSSVPVSGPTTGIARSISPGQGLRNAVYSPSSFPCQSASSSGTGSWPTSVTSECTSTPSQVVMVKPSPAVQSALPVTPGVSLQVSPGAKVFATAQGAKVTFHMTANTDSNTIQPPLKKSAAGSRGFPPPIPPNKPVVPPKKEATIRRSENESKPGEQIKYNLREKIVCPETLEDETTIREPQETCS